jgi:sugar lactone lactonase YvrE
MTMRTTFKIIGLAASSVLVLAACEGGSTEEPACEGEGIICSYLGNGEAGLGEDGLSPLEESLYLPQDLTFGPDGQPYVLDWNNHRVRTIQDGKVQTVIGTGYLGDAMDGPARDASLNHPTHVAFDSEGRIILSAWHNSKVMRYDPETEELTTLCGTGGRDFGGDGGDAHMAILDLPVATAFDSEGRMLIMDQANQRIRRVDEDGIITTVVGPDKNFDPVPDGLQKVCSTNAMTGMETCKLCKVDEAEDPMCALRKPQGFAGDDGPGEEAIMYQPFSQSAPPAGRMEMGPDDTLYFCDTGNHRIRALSADGIVTTVAGSGPDTFDRTYAGGYSGDGGPATEAQLKNPTDVAVAPNGDLFIADTHNSCVRKVSARSGKISTVAGQCGERGFEGDGGPAKEAVLNRPYGVALDTEGNLYIADTHNHRIRVVYGVE